MKTTQWGRWRMQEDGNGGYRIVRYAPRKRKQCAGKSTSPLTLTSKDEGPCLWCKQYVTIGRRDAGCPADSIDPAWHFEGDFGCDASPETTVDGVGDHARPFDLAVRLLGIKG